MPPWPASEAAGASGYNRGLAKGVTEVFEQAWASFREPPRCTCAAAAAAAALVPPWPPSEAVGATGYNRALAEGVTEVFEQAWAACREPRLSAPLASLFV